MVSWRPDRSTPLLLGALMLAAVLYAPLWHAGVVYEDQNWQQALVNGLTWALPGAMGAKPLAIWSLQGPLGLQHLLNVGLHLLNGALVWALARRMAPAAAGVAAVIFLLAPLNSEAVAYLSGRSDLLVTTCALLAALCAIRRGRVAFWLSLAIATVAVWCDQVGLLVIAFVLLTEWRVGTTQTAEEREFRTLVFCCLAAVIAMASANLITTQWHIAYSAEGMNLAWRPFLLYQATALWHLLALIVDPRWLSIDHDIVDLGVAWKLGAVIATAATLIALTLSWRRVPVAAWALGWLVIAVAPHFVFRTDEWLREQQLYLSSPGWSIGIAAAVMWMLPRLEAASAHLAHVLRTSLSFRPHATRSA